VSLPELSQIPICKWEYQEIDAVVCSRAVINFHGEKELDEVRIVALVESCEDVDFVLEAFPVRGNEAFDCKRGIVFVTLHQKPVST